MLPTKNLGEDFIIFTKSSRQTKATIIVSKKVAPRAVDRNRIRRLFKEALQALKLTGFIKIIVHKNLAVLKELEVREKVEKALKNK